jgi:anti-sigma factor RsiW
VGCPTNETLILHHDGELSARDRAVVEAHLPSCHACTNALAGLTSFSALTKGAIDDELDAVSFAGFTQRVMLGIEAERPVALGERIRVWLEEFIANRRRVWVPAAAFALIIAMLGGFWQTRPEPLPPEPGGSAVVSIDASASAIVFDIPSQDGLSSTAVVWVNDEDPSDGGSGT